MALFSWVREFVRRMRDPYELPELPPPSPPKRVQPQLFTVHDMRAAAFGANATDLEMYCLPLNDACRERGIDTKPRIAAFLAQVAHESWSFSRVEEKASGEAYEGRFDLGNTEPGDGPRFKGHGLVQITGRWNHFAAADALGIPRGMIVEYLKSPVGASRSAAWYWSSRSLNRHADACTQDGFDACTKAINGGFNGKADRDRRWRAICAHLGVEVLDADA